MWWPEREQREQWWWQLEMQRGAEEEAGEEGEREGAEGWEEGEREGGEEDYKIN